MLLRLMDGDREGEIVNVAPLAADGMIRNGRARSLTSDELAAHHNPVVESATLPGGESPEGTAPAAFVDANRARLGRRKSK